MTTRDIPIIDAHHHFWDLSLGAQPWLVDAPVGEFRYGDYSAIRNRNFLRDDYARVTAGFDVVGTVTMEAEWDEARLVEETRWTHALHAADPRFPTAHIARTFLHHASAPEELAAQAQFKFVRGIRHKPTAARSPNRVDRSAPGSMSDPAWRRGYAALHPKGLHFELQTPWWHVDDLLDLVAAFPETPVVINHSFLPADRSAEGLAGWRAAIRRAASAPRVAMKISGIGLPDRPWTLADNRAIIRDLIEAFGVDRCLFASNFPVDGICGSFATIYDGFFDATADLPRADRVKMFHDNAVRIYRLEVPRVGAGDMRLQPDAAVSLRLG